VASCARADTEVEVAVIGYGEVESNEMLEVSRGNNSNVQVYARAIERPSAEKMRWNSMSKADAVSHLEGRGTFYSMRAKFWVETSWV
jgi:hypothetical protein